MEKHHPQRVSSPQIHICDVSVAQCVAHLFVLLQLHWGKLSEPFSQADAYRDWSRSCSAQAHSHHHKWHHLPLTLLTPKSSQYHQEGMKMKQSHMQDGSNGRLLPLLFYFGFRPSNTCCSHSCCIGVGQGRDHSEIFHQTF